MGGWGSTGVGRDAGRALQRAFAGRSAAAIGPVSGSFGTRGPSERSVRCMLAVVLVLAGCSVAPTGAGLRSVRIDLQHLRAGDVAARLEPVLDPFCCWDTGSGGLVQRPERSCTALQEGNAIRLCGHAAEVERALHLLLQLDQPGMSVARGTGAMLLANFDLEPTELCVFLRHARAAAVTLELQRTMVCRSLVVDATGKRLPCRVSTWFQGEVDEERNSIRVYGPRLWVRDMVHAIRAEDGPRATCRVTD